MRDYYIEIDIDGSPIGKPISGTFDTPYDRDGRWILLESKAVPGTNYDLITGTWT